MHVWPVSPAISRSGVGLSRVRANPRCISDISDGATGAYKELSPIDFFVLLQYMTICFSTGKVHFCQLTQWRTQKQTFSPMIRRHPMYTLNRTASMRRPATRRPLKTSVQLQTVVSRPGLLQLAPPARFSRPSASQTPSACYKNTMRRISSHQSPQTELHGLVRYLPFSNSQLELLQALYLTDTALG